MIRTLWVWANVAGATLIFGGVAIGASLVRMQGGIYSWATQSWAETILRASKVPVRVHGAEHLLRDAPQIIVSNHVSGYDVFALATALSVPFRFIAKKELERIPFFGRAWKAAGHISVDRSDRRRAVQSLRDAGEKIRREGGAVIIFPEGTRSPSGDLQPFKRGAFLLATEAGLPIVPTVVRGSRGIVGAWGIVSPRPIDVYFGLPVFPPTREESDCDSLLAQVRGQMEAMLHGYGAQHRSIAS